jgi:hypothetical protein
MPQLSLAGHHDPFWDMDGKGARCSRTRRRFVRAAVALIVVLVVALLVTKLPTMDPQYLVSGDGRPILAGALLALLAAMVLIAVARMRHVDDH